MARWDKPKRDGIPDWFWHCVDNRPRVGQIEVDECDVVYKSWGEAGKPGLLLLHGMFAHSHWWDFIAPQLIDRYHVVAMDLTGMGDSDFRYQYNADTYTEEILAVSEAAGLDHAAWLVAHSFGGTLAVKTANRYPDRFAGLILVDSGIRAPDEPVPDRPPMGGRAIIYPDKESALSRFRLQPPQDCENRFLLEYIARKSLMPAEGGWAWKFDDDLPQSLSGVERSAEDYSSLNLPVGLIYGTDSKLLSQASRDYMQELIPGDFRSVALERAQHHVFLDQPLEFVRSLKTLLQAFAH